MKKIISLTLAALPLILTSCATPRPPVAFHNTDNTALVLKSLDSATCQMLQPTMSGQSGNELVLTKAQSLPQHPPPGWRRVHTCTTLSSVAATTSIRCA